MRRAVMLAMLASAALPALATGGMELSLRSRSQAAAASIAVPAAEAPFRVRRDPLPELLYREELARRGPRGACDATATDLCYDLREARVVYRPARRIMPAIEGLRAESISLRHDRIVFKYSFR